MRLRHQGYPNCRCRCYGCKFHCAAHWPWYDRAWRVVRHPGELKPIGHKRWYGEWCWTDNSWLVRRPFIGTDEYLQHTITVMWPFNNGHYEDEPTYWGITFRLPTFCARPLREELDRLRDLCDDVWAPKNRDGGDG